MKFEDIKKELEDELDEESLEEAFSSEGDINKFLTTLKIALKKPGAKLDISAEVLKNGKIRYDINH